MMLSIRNLEYRFGARELFRNVSLEIARGQYAVLIGPNGSGKTTLLKCILRIYNDWKGSIRLDTVDIRTLSRRKTAARIAYVQQSFTSAFSLNVRQFVEMGRFPHLHPMSSLSREDHRIIEESLQIMGIEDFPERTLESLSGGERQKVFLAAALVQQPDLLLLDEPTTFLDYKHQDEIGRLLKGINRQKGTTILEITHDLNRAVLDADHILAISGGKIAFDGSPESLMDSQRLRNIFETDFQLVEHPEHCCKMIVPRFHR